MMIERIFKETKSENYLIESPTIGANICKQGRPGQVSPLCRIFVFVFWSTVVFVLRLQCYLRLCKTSNSLSCKYKISQKHPFAFYVGGRKGQFIYHLFALLVSPPFYHQGIKSNSQYNTQTDEMGKKIMNVEQQTHFSMATHASMHNIPIEVLKNVNFILSLDDEEEHWA